MPDTIDIAIYFVVNFMASRFARALTNEAVTQRMVNCACRTLTGFLVGYL